MGDLTYLFNTKSLNLNHWITYLVEIMNRLMILHLHWKPWETLDGCDVLLCGTPQQCASMIPFTGLKPRTYTDGYLFLYNLKCFRIFERQTESCFKVGFEWEYSVQSIKLEHINNPSFIYIMYVYMYNDNCI